MRQRTGAPLEDLEQQQRHRGREQPPGDLHRPRRARHGRPYSLGAHAGHAARDAAEAKHRVLAHRGYWRLVAAAGGRSTEQRLKMCEAGLAVAGRPEETKLGLAELAYETPVGEERFVQFTTPDDRLVAFLRLLLPSTPAPLAELEGSALIREVHVYGASLALGHRGGPEPQHLGLGHRLIDQAAAKPGALASPSSPSSPPSAPVSTTAASASVTLPSTNTAKQEPPNSGNSGDGPSGFPL